MSDRVVDPVPGIDFFNDLLRRTAAFSEMQMTYNRVVTQLTAKCDARLSRTRDCKNLFLMFELWFLRRRTSSSFWRAIIRSWERKNGLAFLGVTHVVPMWAAIKHYDKLPGWDLSRCEKFWWRRGIFREASCDGYVFKRTWGQRLSASPFLQWMTAWFRWLLVCGPLSGSSGLRLPRFFVMWETRNKISYPLIPFSTIIHLTLIQLFLTWNNSASFNRCCARWRPFACAVLLRISSWMLVLLKKRLQVSTWEEERTFQTICEADSVWWWQRVLKQYAS